MLLWIAFALLTAAVLAAVLAPLARPVRPEEADGSAEAGTLAVYRHQLAEIEAERARGLIGAAEAEAAQAGDFPPPAGRCRQLRAQPSRRAAARPPPAQARAASRWAPPSPSPSLTLGLYLLHGSPGMPSSPFAARTDAAKRSG